MNSNVKDGTIGCFRRVCLLGRKILLTMPASAEHLHPIAEAFFFRISNGPSKDERGNTRLAEKSGRAAACSSTGVPTTVVERLRRQRR